MCVHRERESKESAFSFIVHCTSFVAINIIHFMTITDNNFVLGIPKIYGPRVPNDLSMPQLHKIFIREKRLLQFKYMAKME